MWQNPYKYSMADQALLLKPCFVLFYTLSTLSDDFQAHYELWYFFWCRMSTFCWGTVKQQLFSSQWHRLRITAVAKYHWRVQKYQSQHTSQKCQSVFVWRHQSRGTPVKNLDWSKVFKKNASKAERPACFLEKYRSTQWGSRRAQVACIFKSNGIISTYSTVPALFNISIKRGLLWLIIVSYLCIGRIWRASITCFKSFHFHYNSKFRLRRYLFIHSSVRGFWNTLDTHSYVVLDIHIFPRSLRKLWQEFLWRYCSIWNTNSKQAAHLCNNSTLKGEAGGSSVWGHSWLHSDFQASLVYKIAR